MLFSCLYLFPWLLSATVYSFAFMFALQLLQKKGNADSHILFITTVISLFSQTLSFPFRRNFPEFVWTGSSDLFSQPVCDTQHTCECLSARVDPSQPLGCTEIRNLQDATVGVDENIITLRIRKTRVRTDSQIPHWDFNTVIVFGKYIRGAWSSSTKTGYRRVRERRRATSLPKQGD